MQSRALPCFTLRALIICCLAVGIQRDFQPSAPNTLVSHCSMRSVHVVPPRCFCSHTPPLTPIYTRDTMKSLLDQSVYHRHHVSCISEVSRESCMHAKSVNGSCRPLAYALCCLMGRTRSLLVQAAGVSMAVKAVFVTSDSGESANSHTTPQCVR